jgi:hypothetical protein
VNARAMMAAVAELSETAAANRAMDPTRSPNSRWPKIRLKISGK